MKNIFLLLIQFIPNFILAEVKPVKNEVINIKIENNWNVKYDPKVWNFFYAKPFSQISSNMFINSKEKLKLILQKETHFNGGENYHNLITNKCSEANKFYTRNKIGMANIEKINTTEICYLEYKNKNQKLIRQFVYPSSEKSKTYNLYSYGWTSELKNSKMVVSTFLKGFLK